MNYLSCFILLLYTQRSVWGFFHRTQFIHRSTKLYESDKKFPISRSYYDKYMERVGQTETVTKSLKNDIENQKSHPERKFYPFSKNYFESALRRLNTKNLTIRHNEILSDPLDSEEYDEINRQMQEEHEEEFGEIVEKIGNLFNAGNNPREKKIKVVIRNNEGFSQLFGTPMSRQRNDDNDDDDYYKFKNRKSENFEVLKKSLHNFADIGGYDQVKHELRQCLDILCNYQKYSQFNVRVPKGLILEGPPGNGKTLLAKGLAGEAKIGFIPVSGSEFQHKYIGVGATRVRELFELAKKNIPCIVFIDEIETLGRKRSTDGEVAGADAERDNTLNELLVALDGFKNTNGVFVIGATNRPDLLDPALIRPGRIDKRVYIGQPDAKTRDAILNIHIQGKPHDDTIVIKDMVDLTMGLSGAQIENLLNEAMLNALRNERLQMTNTDIDMMLNKMMAGWQPSDHEYTSDIIDQIAIHEMGHAIVGLLCKHHSKMTKVIINLSSPSSPAYTVFEGSTSTIYTREGLFEHLMILLAGRIAEEVFYGVSVTTGAINDFEEALKLAEKMIIYYGMGKNVIYPKLSEKYKEVVDTEVLGLINSAHSYAEFIVKNSRHVIEKCAVVLKRDKVLKSETIMDIINKTTPNIMNLAG
jgi:cell division protease FtsH